MRGIHSVPLTSVHRQRLWVPSRTLFLGVQVNHGSAYLLMEQPRGATTAEEWEVAIFSMNSPIPDDYDGLHIGWYQYAANALTWHVYVRKVEGHGHH